jgi:NTE family protein
MTRLLAREDSGPGVPSYARGVRAGKFRQTARPTVALRRRAPARYRALDVEEGEMARSAAPKTKRINLALQGGGAHGAFTWGVLDRLLEDERIEIESLSGTSAGAMNAAVLTDGYEKGGTAGARRALDAFWERISEFSAFSPVRSNPFDKWFGNWNLDKSPAAMWWDMLGRMFSPYDLNPFNLDPLRDVLAESLDFAALSACERIKLFISATNVRTGKIRVFEKHEVTIEALLASACLPTVFQAVEIDGEPYWDGGYMGNPAIWPMIYGSVSADVVIVQINPLVREGTPRSAAEIADRLNEITFNSALRGEMRAIAFVQQLINSDHVHGPGLDRLKKVHVHMIGDPGRMESLGSASKFNADFEFLLALKEIGRVRTGDWIETTFDALGQRSSIDIREMFL